MRLNIIENLFYRFNPYFPHRRLPVYDVNPDDPQDINVKLGLFGQLRSLVSQTRTHFGSRIVIGLYV